MSGGIHWVEIRRVDAEIYRVGTVDVSPEERHTMAYALQQTCRPVNEGVAP